MDVTYAELLAEQYEENARDMLVYQQENDYNEDVKSHASEDYSDMLLSNTEEFNRFQERHDTKNIINPTGEDTKKGAKTDVDIRTIVLNIDGKFRGNISPRAPVCSTFPHEDTLLQGTSSSHFVFMASQIYRNISSVKLTSLEFYNTFYTFSGQRGNTVFYINTIEPSGYEAGPYTVTIPDGNYLNIVNPTTGTMYLPSSLGGGLDTTTFTGAIQNAIQNALTGSSVSISINYSAIQHKISFLCSTPNASFSISFPQSNTNPSQNGIGYNLGFLGLSYTSSLQVAPGSVGGILQQRIISDTVPDVIQDTYVYLQVNDWNLVKHQEYGQTFFPAYAKITLPGTKNTLVFDNNYLNSSSKEYFFSQPENLQRFEIKMLDAYGNVLDLNGGNFSMTLELKQVNKFSIYQKMLEL